MIFDWCNWYTILAKIYIVKIHYHIAANLKTVAHFMLPLRGVGKQYCLSQIMFLFCVRQNPPPKYGSVHQYNVTCHKDCISMREKERERETNYKCTKFRSFWKIVTKYLCLSVANNSKFKLLYWKCEISCLETSVYKFFFWQTNGKKLVYHWIK